MVKVNIEQGSEAWFELRAGRITGSRYGKMMSGINTSGYQTLVSDLASEIFSGEIEETYVSPAMLRGSELEPEARAVYEFKTGLDVSQVGMCLPDEDNDFHNWIGYSPDGLADNDKILQEFKCPMAKTHRKYLKADKLPNEYKWQVQGGLWLTGADYCDFMSYHPLMEPFLIKVLPDAEMHREFEDRLILTIKNVKSELEDYNKFKLF